MLGAGAVTLIGAPAVAELAGASADQAYVSVIINRVLETERALVEVPWANPETGNRGAIVIERTWYQAAERPCRDYRRTVERPDATTTLRGTGCRLGPGLWAVDETEPEDWTRARPGSDAPPASAPVPDPAPLPRSTADGRAGHALGRQDADPPARAARRAKPPSAAAGPEAGRKRPQPPALAPSGLPPYTLPSRAEP